MAVTGNFFHTSAKPFVATSVTPSMLFSRIQGIMTYMNACTSSGVFTDHYNTSVDTSVASAHIAYAAFYMAVNGDTTYVNTGIAAMDHAISKYLANDNSNFILPSIAKAYGVAKSISACSSHLAGWKSSMTKLVGSTLNPNGNWGAYFCDGCWLLVANGVITSSQQVTYDGGGTKTAAQAIEAEWSSYLVNYFQSNGLFADPNANIPYPASMSTELTGRSEILTMILNGYNGSSASAMSAAVLKGCDTQLQTLSPDGSVGNGGRTSDHLWVDSGFMAVSYIMAQYYLNSQPSKAQQFLRWANLCFNHIEIFKITSGTDPNGVSRVNTFPITKNHFGDSAKVGWQESSSMGYEANQLQLTVDAHKAYNAIYGQLSEAPCTAEIGGYVNNTTNIFVKTIAAAGTVQVTVDKGVNGTTEHNQSWDALGITRVSKTGFDPRLGPADTYATNNVVAGTSIAPVWNQGGTWIELGAVTGYNPSNGGNGSYRIPTVTTVTSSPALTIITLVWPTNGSYPTHTQTLTITPDGVLSQITSTAAAGAFGHAFPLLTSDGATSTTTTHTAPLATTSFGGASTQNFISLDGASFTQQSTHQSSYGNLTTYRAVSGASESALFIYPQGSGDPSGSSVSTAFTYTPGSTNFANSALGMWVQGTLYRGRTSAGGYGTSIGPTATGGTPDAVFSAACKFILTLNSSGTITAVETDTTTTATVNGQQYSFTAFQPQVVAAPTSQPRITVSAPGTHPETSSGAGTFNGTITATVANYIGSTVAWKRRNGTTDETSYANATLSGNTATFSTTFSQGDYVRVVDNSTTPTITVDSGTATVTPLSATETMTFVGSLPNVVAGAAFQFTVNISPTPSSLTNYQWNNGSGYASIPSGEMTNAALTSGTGSLVCTVKNAVAGNYSLTLRDSVTGAATTTLQYTVAPAGTVPSGYGAWIPSSPGVGLPRVGIGHYTWNNGVSGSIWPGFWDAEVGITRKFTDTYAAFDTSANLVGNTLVSAQQLQSTGNKFSQTSGCIPVHGFTLGLQDGSMTLVSIPTGANDKTLAGIVDAWFSNDPKKGIATSAGGGYNEVWFRLNHECTYPTCPGGYSNSVQTAWGTGATKATWPALFKAAFQYTANYIRTYTAATYPGKIVRIIFDLVALNNVDANIKGLGFVPDAAYFDMVGMDFYGGQLNGYTDRRYPGYAAMTPYTTLTSGQIDVASPVGFPQSEVLTGGDATTHVGATITTQNTPGATASVGGNQDAWVTDYATNAGPGNIYSTTDNMAHQYCFVDATGTNVNGAAGLNQLDIITKICIAKQRPLFIPEFGILTSRNNVNGVAHSGAYGSTYLCTNTITSAVENAGNDRNFFAYFKRMIAAIENKGVPFIGFIVWDGPNGSLLSGPAAICGGLTDGGMRAGLTIFNTGGTSIPPVDSIDIGTIGAVTINGTVSVTAAANYTPVLSNLTFKATSISSTFQTMPASARVTNQTITLTFPAGSVAGNFQVFINDATNNVASIGADYTVNPAATKAHSITVPDAIPQQKAGQRFFVQVAFNYVPDQTKLYFSPTGKTITNTTGGVSFSSFGDTYFGPITWDTTGQVATLPFTLSSQSPHLFAILDTSTTPAVESKQLTFNIGTTGGTPDNVITVSLPPPTVSQSFVLTATNSLSGTVGGSPILFHVDAALAMTPSLMRLVVNGALNPLPSGATFSNSNLALDFAYTPPSSGDWTIQVAAVPTTPGGATTSTPGLNATATITSSQVS